MRTNVEYLERELFVNEKKRTVVCKLKSAIAIPEAFGDMIYNYATLDNFIDKKTREGIVLDYDSECVTVITTGVAKCSEEDDFNQSIGEMIAITKAQMEVFNFAEQIFSKIMKTFKYVHLNELEQLINGNHKSYKNCNAHVKEIYDGYKSLLEEIENTKESNS